MNVAWMEVLCGSKDVTSVWKEGAEFQQVNDNFNNRKTSIEYLKESLGILYHDTHDDQVQAFYFLQSFCRPFSSHQTFSVTKLKAFTNEYGHIFLKSNSYRKILQKVDSVF